jgi:hypothetical protein
MPYRDTWTRENLRLLRHLWVQPVTLREIALRMGRSMSGISGKAHKMGLGHRETGGKPGVPHPIKKEKALTKRCPVCWARFNQPLSDKAPHCTGQARSIYQEAA